MDITVVGIGNIGTLYGWALAAAGHNVTHVVRSAAPPVPEVAALDILDERSGGNLRRYESYAWNVSAAPPSGADLVLIATPATAVRDAVLHIARSSPDATYLTWALEWDAVQLSDLVPADRLLVGYPDSGGTRDPDAHYVLSLGAEPHLGRRAGSNSSDSLREVEALFRAATFKPSMEDPFEPWLWVHCANTIPYWVALNQDRDVARFSRNRPLLKRAFRASREVLQVAAARGTDLDRYDEVGTTKVPAWLFPWAFRLLYRTNEGMRRAAAHGVAGIAEGTALADQILASAETLGVETPILRALVAEASSVGGTSRPVSRIL